MHPSYRDITSRIAEEPLWWDTNGVPRYEPFHPDLASDIYAREVALLEIACQECGRTFYVERLWHPWHREASLRAQITRWDGNPDDFPFHYGDPPSHADCPAGNTMNCDDLRVVEVWYRASPFDWQKADLEELVGSDLPLEKDADPQEAEDAD